MHTQNIMRADWAKLGVDAFARETYCGQSFDKTLAEQPDSGDDAYTMIQDLMTNLMHLAHSAGWDALDLARRASANYAHETQHPED